VQDRADAVPLLFPRVLFVLLVSAPLGGPAAAQEPSPPKETPPEAESPAAPEPVPQQQPEPPADTERIQFDRIPLSEESGGGFVEGSAAVVEFDGTKGVLAGDVVIRYQDVQVKADRVELDQETEDLVAEGNVVFDRGPERITGRLLLHRRRDPKDR
jgi:hypothetical protein